MPLGESFYCSIYAMLYKYLFQKKELEDDIFLMMPDIGWLLSQSKISKSFIQCPYFNSG